MAVEYEADSSGVSSAVPECSSHRSSDPEDLPPVNIRISVFFDGTGNNLFNTDRREDGRGTRGDRDHRGSYENAYSNNARLATNITTTNSENNFHFPVYVEGVGTYHDSADDTRGMGFGSGNRGVIQRVVNCVIRTGNSIISLCNGNRRIQSLKIDVFGFSRGAAAARYFVFRVLHTPVDTSSTDFLIHNLTNSYGFSISEKKMPFVGLFDSVASFRPHVDLSFENDRRQLQLDSIQRPEVEKVVQLAAADEHRMNFPLSNIASAGSKGTQIFLPGVHSDIGGGYNNITLGNMIEDNLVVFELEGNQFTGVAQRNIMYETCNRVKDNLLSLGWYNNCETEIRPGLSRSELMVRFNEDTFSYQVLANRANISNKYSWIALHIMAEKAGEKDLHFDLVEFPLSDDNRLVRFKTRIENNTSSDQQWMTANDPQLKDIRHSFFHFSSHYTPLDIWVGLAWPMQPQLCTRTGVYADNHDNDIHLNETTGPIQLIRRRKILEG